LDLRRPRRRIAADAVRRRPPDAARPEIFWDWLHDMVSRKGITLDLEAMKRIGLGGALIMLAVFRG
jgi:alpha-L-rhamnosidase